MRDSMRRWRRLRSPHARVLEGLEQVLASHRSSGRRRARRPDDDRVVPLHPDGRPDAPDDGPSAA